MTLAWTAFALAAAHFIIDFPLQGDTTAREKSPRSTTELQRHVPWPYWLTAHAFSHAAAVAVITGSLKAALFELVGHALIDWLKSTGRLSIHQDQAAHLGMKLSFLVCLFGQ